VTEAGEHFTPRDIVELMAELAITPLADKITNTTYRIYEIITQSLIQFDFAFLPRTPKGASRIKRVHLNLKGCNVKRYGKAHAMAA
jgi:hypothetical protein